MAGQPPTATARARRRAAAYGIGGAVAALRFVDPKETPAAFHFGRQTVEFCAFQSLNYPLLKRALIASRNKVSYTPAETTDNRIYPAPFIATETLHPAVRRHPQRRD